ncbi:MAG: hypothetical protein Q7K54_04975 [Candidatus Parcubacteria bacterium]|nr:hypothetical protein [Candidatus Parcubacteria bacterium]
MLTFVIILITVVLISFVKVYTLKNFLIEFPENCESDSNTCVENDGELRPTRFILLRESYLLQNCDNKGFDFCLEKCEKSEMCTLEIDESSRLINNIE